MQDDKCFVDCFKTGSATWGLAALGFPNSAESGARNGNLSNMEPLRVLGIALVAIFLQLPEVIVNGRRCGGKNSDPEGNPTELVPEGQE
jgi:hypothetical protein